MSTHECSLYQMCIIGFNHVLIVNSTCPIHVQSTINYVMKCNITQVSHMCDRYHLGKKISTKICTIDCIS